MLGRARRGGEIVDESKQTLHHVHFGTSDSSLSAGYWDIGIASAEREMGQEWIVPVVRVPAISPERRRPNGSKPTLRKTHNQCIQPSKSIILNLYVYP